MAIQLPADVEAHIRQKVDSGDFPDAGEVVREAMRLLDEQEYQLAELRTKLQIGLDQLNRGDKPRQRVVDAEQQHWWPLRCGNSGGPRGITKPIVPGLFRMFVTPAPSLPKFGKGRPRTLLLGVNHFVARWPTGREHSRPVVTIRGVERYGVGVAGGAGVADDRAAISASTSA